MRIRAQAYGMLPPGWRGATCLYPESQLVKGGPEFLISHLRAERPAAVSRVLSWAEGDGGRGWLVFSTIGGSLVGNLGVCDGVMSFRSSAARAGDEF